MYACLFDIILVQQKKSFFFEICKIFIICLFVKKIFGNLFFIFKDAYLIFTITYLNKNFFVKFFEDFRYSKLAN